MALDMQLASTPLIVALACALRSAGVACSRARSLSWLSNYFRMKPIDGEIAAWSSFFGRSGRAGDRRNSLCEEVWTRQDDWPIRTWQNGEWRRVRRSPQVLFCCPGHLQQRVTAYLHIAWARQWHRRLPFSGPEWRALEMPSAGALIYIGFVPIIKTGLCIAAGFFLAKKGLFPTAATKGAGHLAMVGLDYVVEGCALLS